MSLRRHDNQNEKRNAINLLTQNLYGEFWLTKVLKILIEIFRYLKHFIVRIFFFNH